MDTRILIVGTVPYNESATSRAFDSYFHGWDRSCLAQIFSDPRIPPRGHCGSLYQITDRRMLDRWLDRHTKVGRAFRWEDCEEASPQMDSLTRRLYRWGRRKTPLIYLLRGLLWRDAFWHTEELDAWLEEFRPECVFLSFSDDFFIPKIALYAAEKFDIPIVSSIGDDYYFNYRFSLSPLYHIYKLSYRGLVREIFRHRGSAIYIGNKIRDKYNAAFGLKGQTVYLASTLERRPFRPIDASHPRIAYFGNLGLGRNLTLTAIADALGRIHAGYTVDIYSNETDPTVTRCFAGNPNIRFHGSVPYDRVTELTQECDLLLIPEGFSKKDVDTVRYSLSTKAADALCSGAAVFACGHQDCGAIEYCAQTGCVTVCTDLDKLEDQLRQLIFDPELQKRQYDAAGVLLSKRHRLKYSTEAFQDLVKEVMRHESCR